MQGASKKALLESPLHVALKPPTTWLAWQSDEPTTSSAGQDKTKIAARLIPAVIAAKPVNRSSDLVPLNRDYDLMRRELKAIIASAKKYHDAVIQLDQARLDIATRFSLLATKSPIFEPIGHPSGGDSLITVAQAASKKANALAASYEDKVVDYCIEWERIITSRVDAELKETNKMHFKLNHYTSKVLGLRKKVNSHNNRGNETPDKKLSEKLKRNEVKLQDAWKAHERSASKLCDLIEEVTARGWKDLYPLVTASMQLEVERASGEYSDIAKLAVISDSLTDFFNNSMSAELNSAHNHTAIATGTIESATLDRLHQGNNNSNKGQKEKNMLPELKSSRLVIENNDTDPKSTAPFFTKEKDLIPLINGDVTDAGWCKAPASPRRNDARKDGRLKLFESRVPHVVETSQSGSALETDDCESEWTGSTHLGDSTPYDEDQTAASPHRNAIAPKVTSTPDSPNAVQQF